MNSPLPAPEWELIRGKKLGQDPTATGGKVAGELLEYIPVVGSLLNWAKPRSGVPMPASPQAIKEVLDTAYKVSPLGGGVKKPNEYDIASIAKILGMPGTGQVRKTVSRLKQGKGIPQAIVGTRMESKASKKDMIKRRINKLKDDFRAGKIKNPEYQRKLDKLLAERRSISND